MTAQEVYIDNFPTINDYLYHHLIEEQEKSESNLRINKVVVSKPELPENIRRNYEVIVEEKSRLAAASQQQLRRLKEAETEQLERKRRAELEKLIADIENEKKLAEEKMRWSVRRSGSQSEFISS